MIVLTASEDRNEFVQAMKLGCSGIVRKQSAPELIVKGIRKVFAGEIWLDSNTKVAVMRKFAAPVADVMPAPGHGERSPLSRRECEVVNLVVQGNKNKDIAQRLFISEQTVKNHLHNIFGKVEVSDRLGFALYAVYNGLHLQQ
jgi:DNA-binding NarL/FixJ family response regulator